MTEHTSETLRALGPETLEERGLHLRLWGALDDHVAAWRAERIAHADAWKADRIMLDGAGKTNDELWRRIEALTLALQVATCTCAPRPDPLDVQLDGVPGHHDFSCGFRERMQPILRAMRAGDAAQEDGDE